MGVRRGTVTVVSGPPGAGKTTALAAWAAARRWPGPVAWLTVDEYDSKPGLFWRYVSAALLQAGVPVPGPAAAGHAADPEADPTALLRFACVLAGQRRPAVLVLDDLHLLGHTAAGQLAYVMRHAAPGLRLVTASRGKPPLPLHQYLLSGDLAEIREDQLAFTGPEARQLLRNHGVTDYSQSLVSLISETEGWAAGLRLAALARREQASGTAAGVQHPASAYLTSEVLDPLPPDVRAFLLRTSVLDSVSPELALAVTGQEHAAVILAGLVRASTFIQSAGDGWYRYHALFAEVLQARLREEHPGMAADLRRAAAGWFRQQGRLPDAVRYAVGAGDWELAARLVVDELAVSRMLDPEAEPELAALLHGMPSRAWSEPRPFLVTAAAALARPDHGVAAVWLGRADAMLGAPDAGEQLPARLAAAVTRFDLARCVGDLDAMGRAAAETQTVLGRLPREARAQHPELAVRALSNDGGAALWAGQLDDAAKLLAEAVALPLPAAPVAGEPARCTGLLALAEALAGRLGHAAELTGRAIPAGDGPAPDRPPNVPAELAFALVSLERCELPGVRDSLKRAEAGLRAHRDRAAAALASLVAARLYIADGHPAAALRMVGQARQDWSPPGWLERRLHLAESRACALAGDTRGALDAAGRCGDDSDLDAAVARAAAWLAAGDPRAARRVLRGGLHAAEGARVKDPRPEAPLEALVLDARIGYALGDRAAGRHSLARALGIARAEGVRLPFAMEHAWLLPVLRTDVELAMAYQALVHADGEAGGEAGGQAGGRDAARALLLGLRAPAVVEPLSDREQQVLTRVAQLMSTAEIATELCISVNTVKTHLKSVHRKLGVAHRREAVRRARQLRLI